MYSLVDRQHLKTTSPYQLLHPLSWKPSRPNIPIVTLQYSMYVCMGGDVYVWELAMTSCN